MTRPVARTRKRGSAYQEWTLPGQYLLDSFMRRLFFHHAPEIVYIELYISASVRGICGQCMNCKPSITYRAVKSGDYTYSVEYTPL